MTRDEWLELLASTAEAARSDSTSGAYALCDRCGRCEYAGGFCSWCRTAGYTLTAHRHHKGESCPLLGRSTAGPGDVLGTWYHPPTLLRRRRAA